MQPKFSQNAAKMQSNCSQNAAKFSQNAAKIQSNAARIQSNAEKMQPKFAVKIRIRIFILLNWAGNSKITKKNNV